MVFLLFPHAKVHIFSETTKRCHDYLIRTKEGFQNIAVRGKAPTVRKTTDSNNFKSTTSLAQEHYLFGSRGIPL